MTHPVVPVKTYFVGFLGLIALTITTVLVSKIDLGEYNFIAAMTIAVVKGTLVVLFFMHVRQSTSMIKLFVLAGFFWMAILFVFVLSDYFTRGWLPGVKWFYGLSLDSDFNERAFVYANGSMTDLNGALTSNPQNLYLLQANSVNASGESVGLAATAAATGHGFLVTPDSVQSFPPLSERTVSLNLSENVRKALLRRSGIRG